MNLLGMGPMELMLILVLALIVFGPGKLPEIAGQVGKSVRDFRRATSELSTEFNRTLSLEVEERKSGGTSVPAEPPAVAPSVAATTAEAVPAAPVTAAETSGSVATASGGPTTTVAAPVPAAASVGEATSSAPSTDGDGTGWHWETSGAAASTEASSGSPAPPPIAEVAAAPKANGKATNGKARSSDKAAGRYVDPDLAPPY